MGFYFHLRSSFPLARGLEALPSELRARDCTHAQWERSKVAGGGPTGNPAPGAEASVAALWAAAPTLAAVVGPHPGPARPDIPPASPGHPPARRGTAPRLPRNPELGCPLRSVVALRPRCALWRPWRAARGDAHCAKLPAPRVRAAGCSPPLQSGSGAPGPLRNQACPPRCTTWVPDTFASRYPPCGVFSSTRRQLFRFPTSV